MNSRPILDQLDAFTGFVRARTGDPELAADIVQESVLKALRAENTPTDDEGVVTWFYRILRHAIIDAHRRSSVRDKALDSYAAEAPAEVRPEDEKAVCQCVLKLLSELPPADATLLRRVDLEGESASEVARLGGKRINTVNVRLLRARRRLREHVEKVCRACATHGCMDCDC